MAAETTNGKPAWVLSSVDKAAFVLGVSPGVLRKDWRGRGCPFSPGHHDLKELFAWRVADLRRQFGEPSTDNEADGSLYKRKLEAEVAKLREQVRTLQRENRQADGELLPRDEVERAVAGWAAHLRREIEQLPTLCSHLAPSELKPSIHRMAESHIITVLTSAYNERPVGKAIEDVILEVAEKIRAERGGQCESK